MLLMAIGNRGRRAKDALCPWLLSLTPPSGVYTQSSQAEKKLRISTVTALRE